MEPEKEKVGGLNRNMVIFLISCIVIATIAITIPLLLVYSKKKAVPVTNYTNPFLTPTPSPTAYQNPFEATPTPAPGNQQYQNPFAPK